MSSAKYKVLLGKDADKALYGQFGERARNATSRSCQVRLIELDNKDLKEQERVKVLATHDLVRLYFPK